MHIVVDYEELDPDPAQWFAEHPTLADSLNAVRSSHTWSSNPYIEHAGAMQGQLYWVPSARWQYCRP